MEHSIKITTKVKTYELVKANRDVNGNPRYIISFIALGLEKYETSKEIKQCGLKKYRGKLFGGGFIFQSHNPQRRIELIEEILKIKPDENNKKSQRPRKGKASR